MPETSAFVIKTAKELLKTVKWPEQVLPLDEASLIIRTIVMEQPIRFEIVRVAIAVWLFQRLTRNDPTVITIIGILSDPALIGNQRAVMDHLSVLYTRKVIGPVDGDKSKVRIRTHIRKEIGDV